MLKISKKTYEILGREYFFGKVNKFLLERTSHTIMQQVLLDKGIWKPIWEQAWDKAKDMNEYFSGVTLTYVLACHCEKLDPKIMLSETLSSPDPEFDMKIFLSDYGYIRLSEFDIQNNDNG